MEKDVFKSCLVAAYRKAKWNYAKVDCYNVKTHLVKMIEGKAIDRKWWANIVIVALRNNKRYIQQKAVDKFIKEGGEEQWKKLNVR